MRHAVPAYSQHLDVGNPKWREHACGIAALQMVLGYYDRTLLSLDELIELAVKRGAYLEGVGWKHKELADLASALGCNGKNFDWAPLSPDSAYCELLKYFPKHPVLASIHNGFDTEKGGHIVVLTGLDGDLISYNDPDATERDAIEKTVSKDVFLKGWKRRIILVTP